MLSLIIRINEIYIIGLLIHVVYINYGFSLNIGLLLNRAPVYISMIFLLNFENITDYILDIQIYIYI